MKSCANLQNLFPDKIFDIQTSFGNPILTVKEVWPSISLCQSQSLPVYQDFENRKNTKGSPLWNGKKFLSPISLKFYVWDPLTIRISNFRFFFKKKFFKIFPFFPNARGPPKNFDVKNFKFFGKKCQKWLYWVLASTKRNKVMNFGEPSPCSVATVNGFMVQRVKKTFRWNRVNGNQWVQLKSREIFLLVFAKTQ